MTDTHFYGEDICRIIEALRPELGDQFQTNFPSIWRRMDDVIANPSRPVSLRTADAIFTAMGCPHCLVNGAVRVATGYHRKAGVYVPPPVFTYEEPGIWLPSPPFRRWMERQLRHYRSAGAMFIDLDLDLTLAKGIWKGTIKQVHSSVVEAAASHRDSHIELIYPRFRLSA